MEISYYMYRDMLTEIFNKIDYRNSDHMRNWQSIMLVCKDWYRIARPIFYKTEWFDFNDMMPLLEILHTNICNNDDTQFISFLKWLKNPKEYRLTINVPYNLNIKVLKELLYTWYLESKDDYNVLIVGNDTLDINVLLDRIKLGAKGMSSSKITKNIIINTGPISIFLLDKLALSNLTRDLAYRQLYNLSRQYTK